MIPNLRRPRLSNALAALLLIALSAGGPGLSTLEAQADHYRIRAVLDPPTGRLRAEATISWTADSTTSHAELWLNRGLTVGAVDATAPVRRAVRDTLRGGEIRWAAATLPVRVEFERPLRAGETVDLTLRYAGTIVQDEWQANMLTEAWFELAMYSGWYPLVPGDQSFTYDTRARVPGDYRATGLGTVTREDSAGSALYRVVQRTPVNDMVLAGSRDLRTRVVGEEFRIRLSHVDLSPDEIDRIAAAAADILDRFGAWFGPSDLREIEFLFSPREKGGGYARPGLVVMQLDPDTDVAGAGFLRYLAHEVAHLWWVGASYDTWQDWLNESFAEYAALMLLRERLGSEAMDQRIRDYRAEADSTPPIRGIERGHDQAFQTLYRKGPVLLHELEGRLGRDLFLDFLRTLRREEVRTTDRLLAVLARVGSPADRDWLDAALDRPGL